jgi:hypothetical protein
VDLSRWESIVQQNDLAYGAIKTEVKMQQSFSPNTKRKIQKEYLHLFVKTEKPATEIVEELAKKHDVSLSTIKGCLPSPYTTEELGIIPESMEPLRNFEKRRKSNVL